MRFARFDPNSPNTGHNITKATPHTLELKNLNIDRQTLNSIFLQHPAALSLPDFAQYHPSNQILNTLIRCMNSTISLSSPRILVQFH